MSSYKADVHDSPNKYHDSHYSELVAAYVKYISAILHVISRRELSFSST